MLGSVKLRRLLQPVVEALAELPYPLTKPEILDFALAFDAQIAVELENNTREHLWGVLSDLWQGDRDQGPLMIYLQSKGESAYVPRAIQATPHKNRYLARGNKTMVSIREKLAVTRDEVEASGDRATPLFVVGLALDPENDPIVRVEPMTRARLELSFPEWISQDQFGQPEGEDDEEEN